MSEYKVDVENLDEEELAKEIENSRKILEEEPKRSGFREFLSWAIPIIIAIVVVWGLKRFVIINANVPSGSMENTIMTDSNLIGFRLAYSFSDPKRGDIVIFPDPDKKEDEKGQVEKLIKRIIGLPGDTVEIKKGHVYINGELLEEDYVKEDWSDGTGSDGISVVVPEGCYFMMGDNRKTSLDARFWENKFVKREDIIGKAWLVYWPFSEWHTL